MVILGGKGVLMSEVPRWSYCGVLARGGRFFMSEGPLCRTHSQGRCGEGMVLCESVRALYRGTSLIRNGHPP